MRKLALLVPVFAVLFSCHIASAQFASDQQADFFIGGGTLLSAAPTADNDFLPAERGGTYIDLGGDVIFLRHNLGVNVETAFRATQGTYQAGVENYRPILTDFNLLWQPRIGKRVGLDLMGGIGAGATRYYQPGPSCSGCINYVSSDHFMEHLGGGVRFYVWNHIFVRPEVNYYHIQNNNTAIDAGFSSNNVVRVGASVGFTIGGPK